MGDVIQQAREALDNPWAMQSEYHDALRAVVEAADAGHLIDTRRMAQVSSLDKTAATPSWRYTDWEMARAHVGATAADALAAAEREAK